MKMNDKIRQRTCLAIIAIVVPIVFWITYKIVFSGDQLYDHVGAICIAGAIAFALIMVAIAVMWNYTGSAAKTLTATALIAVAAVTVNAGDKDKSRGGITTGLTNPYGNPIVAQPTWPYGWLTSGWGGWLDFFRDGLDTWVSGHPVITIDPNPPASDDTSSK